MTKQRWRRSLGKELLRLGELVPAVKSPEDRFTLWYLLASVTDNLQSAADAVTNGSGDGGLDAIYIDDQTRTVLLLQAKYHGPSHQATLQSSEIDKLGRWVWPIARSSGAGLIDDWASRSDVRDLARRARAKVRAGYRLRLVIVTTGTSTARRRELTRLRREVKDVATLDVLDVLDVEYLYHSWGEGATPLLGEVQLAVEGPSSLDHSGRDEGISSTVVSVSGKTLAELYETYGDRLFARNIRGYQGQTDVNEGMQDAIERRPGRFFFLNNGITILTDRCERSGANTRPKLKLTNPQIVNGQQTTRTIAAFQHRAASITVLAKIVALPTAAPNNRKMVEQIVGEIVRASNSQNSVSTSDLISNDTRQIWLERSLQPLGFGYVRKKMSRTEARKRFGGRRLALIKRRDLVRAVAATLFDPLDVRRGEDHLLEAFYDDLFASQSPFDYLARWRLFEAATRVSRTRAEWGYAKWIAMYVVWHALSPVLRSQAQRRRWVELHSNRQSRLARATEQLLRIAYGEAIYLFRAKRSPGQDVSSFYKGKKDLHLSLKKRFVGSRVRTSIKKVRDSLDT